MLGKLFQGIARPVSKIGREAAKDIPASEQIRWSSLRNFSTENPFNLFPEEKPAFSKKLSYGGLPEDVVTEALRLAEKDKKNKEKFEKIYGSGIYGTWMYTDLYNKINGPNAAEEALKEPYKFKEAEEKPKATKNDSLTLQQAKEYFIHQLKKEEMPSFVEKILEKEKEKLAEETKLKSSLSPEQKAILLQDNEQGLGYIIRGLGDLELRESRETDNFRLSFELQNFSDKISKEPVTVGETVEILAKTAKFFKENSHGNKAVQELDSELRELVGNLKLSSEVIKACNLPARTR